MRLRLMAALLIAAPPLLAADLQLVRPSIVNEILDPDHVATSVTYLENQRFTAAHDVRVGLTPSGGAVVLSVSVDGGGVCDASGCTFDAIPGHETRVLTVTLRTAPWSPSTRQGVEIAVTASDATVSAPLLRDYAIFRWFPVTSTADRGSGSLRQAILDANSLCSPTDFCKIAFRVAPPVPVSGWYTIAPRSPLPMVDVNNIELSGETQRELTGDTNPGGPVIEVSGDAAGDSNGFDVVVHCDTRITGLAIDGFALYGLNFEPSGYPCTVYGGAMEVANNVIGADPATRTARPNLRGIRADEFRGAIHDNVISGNRRSGIWQWTGTGGIYNNKIGTAADGITALPNGGSGIFIGPEASQIDVRDNAIAFNREMGVAIARDAQFVNVRHNEFRGNGGLAIDIGLDGADPVGNEPDRPNAPALLAANYDPASDTTSVTISVNARANPFSDIYWLELYSNANPFNQGETPIGPNIFGAIVEPGGPPVLLSLPGNYTGKWITATSTLSQFFAKTGSGIVTSEFSNAVPVTGK